jgi:hypothetical protein
LSNIPISPVNVTGNTKQIDQETQDALFEAGYTTEEINKIVTTGSLDIDRSLDSTDVTLDSDELRGEDSENEDENANDILRTSSQS